MDRAFDASEVYYRDSENAQPSGWSTAALFVSLKRTFERHPFDRTLEQHQEVAACMSELARRGFDVELIAHGPLADSVTQAIVGSVLGRTLSEAESSENPDIGEVDSRTSLRDSMYADALEKGELASDHEVSVNDRRLDQETAAKIVFTVAGDFHRHVTNWCRAASVEDLLSWNVSADAQGPAPEGRPDRLAVWMFDRFTVTYLSDWAPESLRLEWAYRRGNENLAPVSPAQMALRHVDMADLADRVADLAVAGDERAIRDQHLVRNAAAMLRAGKRDAAAALFEAVRQSDWDDPELHNNYGFCVLPDDPGAALKALDLASSKGFKGTVNVANRALCLLRLGRPVAAIELLESAYEIWDQLDAGSSYVWGIEEPDKDRLLQKCPRCYLVGLGARVAESTSDAALTEVWQRRERELVRKASRSARTENGP
ncbi:hypothetical protein [Friedmanniella luteola]|uniref:hypothetical protein n=1 Tax=Friedmanniella luteola TaxID=546871 RepID=UPI000B85FCF0|nr:hypothetical protein [Friedmanniella luteola]